MSESTNSKVQAKVWLKPRQVEQLRSACYSTGADYLQQRNEAIIAMLANTGLRVGELIAIDVEFLRENNGALYLPTEVQKDHRTESSPRSKTLELSTDVQRLFSAYLNNRWKDTQALFPSRSGDRITTQGVRDILHKVAAEAEIKPYKLDGSRGDADDVTPHTLRHSVAYRMMVAEDGNTIYDVQKRLRHRSIQTTERVYSHIDRI
jgi:integrase/recombinase XerC/integrase/recombinase XerD